MKKTVLSLLLAMALFLCGCSTETVNHTITYDSRSKDTLLYSADVYEEILSGATADFIGHHPIDESFLAWVSVNYGEEVLTTIAENGDFVNSQIWRDLTGCSIHVLWDSYCRQTGIQNYTLERTKVMECSSADNVVLDFSGDLSFADGVATTEYMLEQENGISDCFSEDLLLEMKSADIFMINNEFAYTNRGEAQKGKAYTFRSNPKNVTLLDDLGVDIVGLANNHVWDFGEIGMRDTIETLNKAQMPYVGAGMNLEEACQPYYFICNGFKIAIVNATQVERAYTYTKQATDTMAGVLKTLDPALFSQVIAQAKENADFCLVMVHWGTEGNSNYGSDQVRLANAFVSAGADAIIGGHTHCLQGIEYVSGVPVFYSLGNYWFATTSEMPKDYDTALAQITISNDGSLSCKLIPCEFSAGVTELVTDTEEKIRIEEFVQNVSEGTLIAEDGSISPKSNR